MISNNKTDIKIGIPVSMTGQFSVQGQQIYQGIDMWMTDFNNREELLSSYEDGYNPSLLVYDDNSNVKTLTKVMSKMINEDKVDIMLGPYSTGLIKTAAKICRDNKKVLWNHSGASKAMHDEGNRYLVSILSSCHTYLSGLANLTMANQLDPLVVASIHCEAGEFSREVTKSGVASYNKCPRVICHEKTFHPSLNDFQAIIKDLIHLNPDVIIFIGRIHHDIEFCRQIHDSPIRSKIICVGAAGITQFREALQYKCEYVVGPSQWEYNEYDSNYNASVSEKDKIKNLKKFEYLDYPVIQAYVAGLIIEECVRNVSELSQEKLREFVATLDMNTLFGRFKIDDGGLQIGHKPLLVQWRDGHKVVVSNRSDLMIRGDVVC